MTLDRWRYELAWRVQSRPLLYPLVYPAVVALHGSKRGELVRRDSDIVIEGFPRSGNTFAVQAFLYSNPGATTAAHLHSPIQITRALRFEVPLLVVIRDPEEAVSSVLVRSPVASPEESLRRWIAFYRAVPPASGRCVVAPFATLTTDYGSILRQVNKVFGTQFVPYEGTRADDEAVFSRIDDEARMYYSDRSQKEFEELVSRPSAHRAELLDRARARLTATPRGRALLDEAKELLHSVGSMAHATED